MQITIGLLKKAMLKSNSRGFLIDGFPRALDQAKTFEQQIQPCDMVRLPARLPARSSSCGFPLCTAALCCMLH